MDNNLGARTDDPFLVKYNATDLRIASEFLSNWLPFLSTDLCLQCTQTLSDRIRSLAPEIDGDVEPIKQEENSAVLTSKDMDLNEIDENHDNCNTNSLGSWKDAADLNDTADTNSLGSWKDEASGWSDPAAEASSSETVGSAVVTSGSPRVRMSWADMAQEDELEEEEEENEVNGQPVNRYAQLGEATVAVKEAKPWKADNRSFSTYFLSDVKRKKDFICLERFKGKIVNILEGLELHTGVFSAAEQKRIVDFVYSLQERGKKGELKERTYTAPQKWMRGKGRVTIQFGCCYNYAPDKNGNPPGILPNENVDPIPHLFKVIIRRLVTWHVLPPSCVPDSCIVNIYEEGDCIPPHIDNHDFVRPFCTVSFLSECNILFGSNLKIVGAGEFSGSIAIPLPVGSVLVLNGNGADVSKHCVPAVPTKRISITFRKMDESKWPIGFVPEPDLQGLQPLSYETNRSKRQTPLKPKLSMSRQVARREDNNRDKARGSAGRGNYHVEPQVSLQIQRGPSNRRRVSVNLDG
ncbi:LOW QUALITY PROTEIN: RNA demethylase ALKBH9B [Camellia sinensis]|uniref:LOW QUALITY PROTEIN: RNA demethylase ALKBH9B n=1 Tax=Camellia sinensis TaxID=4442 RepID=UPI0010365185|nr:LOW QUALITY PROTEIN: RNA demethylase ALKBH9B [Camellia sinensis]